MKKISEFAVKIVNKNICKEMNRVCLVFGYQPYVPNAAKKMKRKNKSE